MADFSSPEKINLIWKHAFGIIGTSNLDGADGRRWYEEVYGGTHVVVPDDIWADSSQIPPAVTQSQAQVAASSGTIINDRSQSVSITLVSNGSDWNISSTIPPVVGHTIHDSFPSPGYTKSITAVVPLGGTNYTITLENNTGVSAGSAVLNTRVILTEDLTSNGLAWFARSVPGDPFSERQLNFIQPQRFGKGYSVRLYEADGTEIFTTQGAWIFNWQQGLLLFAEGFTPADLGYSTPLYIEAFQYNGTLGTSGGEALPSGVLNETLRYNGTDWVSSNALTNNDVDVFVENVLNISGGLVVNSGIGPVPSSSTAFSGIPGEIRYSKNFVYIFEDDGEWRRFPKSKF